MDSVVGVRAEAGLTEYELRRERKLAENRARLEALLLPQLAAAAAPPPAPPPERRADGGAAKRVVAVDLPPPRRSDRARGEAPQYAELPDPEAPSPRTPRRGASGGRGRHDTGKGRRVVGRIVYDSRNGTTWCAPPAARSGSGGGRGS